tara:strand:- start:1621 stop:2166 length:546 start_codon:yes stop_codon:yes gene_type:complete
MDFLTGDGMEDKEWVYATYNHSLYNNECRIQRIVDGDTLDIDIDLGHSVWLNKIRVRLRGIDTPESRTRDKEEKRFGQIAHGAVIDYFSRSGFDKTVLAHQHELSPVIVNTEKKGKFGRLLADFACSTRYESLCDHLLNNHCAVPYTGQSKEEIKEAHLLNREHINYSYAEHCLALYNLDK